MADQIGGTELKAAGLVAADTNHTAIDFGAGVFAIRFAWTAAEVASGDEFYMVKVQANTRAATTTWTEIGTIFVGGDSTTQGGLTDIAASGEVTQGFTNPYGHQIRLATYVNGAIATGLNFSAKAFPIQVLGYV